MSHPIDRAGAAWQVRVVSQFEIPLPGERNEWNSEMTLFCLIHGSIQSPCGWKLLRHALTRRGHGVVTPDLGGVDPAGDAIIYARNVAAAVDHASPQLNEPVWVLAHSASGMFLPWVPGVARSQLSGLIYLAAYVPAPGESLLSSFNSDAGMFNPHWVGKNPMQDRIAQEFLFHDCSVEVSQWAMSTRRLMVAHQAMKELLPDDLSAGLPVRYISCRLDRTLTPAWMKRASSERLGVDPIELECGHCPHLSIPDELADVLAVISRAPPGHSGNSK